MCDPDALGSIRIPTKKGKKTSQQNKGRHALNMPTLKKFKTWPSGKSLTAMTATSAASRVTPLRIPMVVAAAARLPTLRTLRSPVSTACPRIPWPAKPLEPATGLRPTATAPGGFAAFFPHLEHVLRRPGLAPTALRGGHALFHHLAGELRRAALWSTALAALGSDTFLGRHRPFFGFGDAVGSVAPAILAALGVLAPFAPAMPAVIIRHHGGSHPRPHQESGRHSNYLVEFHDSVSHPSHVAGCTTSRSRGGDGYKIPASAAQSSSSLARIISRV